MSTRSGRTIPVQVVDVLHQENFTRELKGLDKARQRLKCENGMLIVLHFQTATKKAVSDRR